MTFSIKQNLINLSNGGNVEHMNVMYGNKTCAILHDDQNVPTAMLSLAVLTGDMRLLGYFYNAFDKHIYSLRDETDATKSLRLKHIQVRSPYIVKGGAKRISEQTKLVVVLGRTTVFSKSITTIERFVLQQCKCTTIDKLKANLIYAKKVLLAKKDLKESSNDSTYTPNASIA